MPRVPADVLLQTLLDPGSWEPWPAEPAPTPATADPSYRQELAAAASESGESESVVIGLGRVAGQQVLVVVSIFDFLAGSVGRRAAERIVTAFDRAADLALPVIGLPTSGGTRMQEGTPAFLQMINIASAVRRHSRLGLPYVVWLRHPTTGGVFATWGSLADITLGQPQALTGFLGPRVYEGLYGEPFPIGVQTSEGLTNAGVIDAALPLEQVRNTVASCLRIWQARPNPPVAQSGARLGRGASAAEPSVGNKFDAQQDLSSGQERGDEQGTRGGKGASVSETSAWDAVLATRADRRPGVTDLLDRAQVSVTLSGTGAGEVAGATQLALALIGETGCVVVGQDGSAQRDGARIGPADLRVARRGMALAAKWRLPFVSIIDTQGGELSADAESGALAGEIARCLADLSELPVPTISVLLGGGAGGAALALLPADRVIAAADAWVTPLPPEGAALIRHRDVGMAAQMADEQRITAQDLAAIGAVDVLLADPEGSAGVAAPYAALQAALANTTTPVAAADGTDAALLERRRQRWRRLAP